VGVSAWSCHYVQYVYGYSTCTHVHSSYQAIVLGLQGLRYLQLAVQGINMILPSEMLKSHCPSIFTI
jgi:hypothetical protein